MFISIDKFQRRELSTVKKEEGLIEKYKAMAAEQ